MILFRFCENVVASRFDCKVGTLKTPFRADICTGTVMLIHCLAKAPPATKVKAKTDNGNILELRSSSVGAQDPNYSSTKNKRTVANTSFK